MYYPYLRARQFELIAIRELAIEGLSQKHVLPIFEPVKDSSNNLRLANKIFAEHTQRAYLVFNPLVGELKDKTEQVATFYNEFEIEQPSRGSIKSMDRTNIVKKDYLLKFTKK